LDADSDSFKGPPIIESFVICKKTGKMLCIKKDEDNGFNDEDMLLWDFRGAEHITRLNFTFFSGDGDNEEEEEEPQEHFDNWVLDVYDMGAANQVHDLKMFLDQVSSMTCQWF